MPQLVVFTTTNRTMIVSHSSFTCKTFRRKWCRFRPRMGLNIPTANQQNWEYNRIKRSITVSRVRNSATQKCNPLDSCKWPGICTMCLSICWIYEHVTATFVHLRSNTIHNGGIAVVMKSFVSIKWCFSSYNGGISSQNTLILKLRSVSKLDKVMVVFEPRPT